METITTATPTTSSTQNKKMKKSVRFDTLEILEFPMIFGSSSSCHVPTVGPPIQASWIPSSRICQSIDEYEHTRSPRRDLHSLILSSSERNEIIKLVETNPLHDSPRSAVKKSCLEKTENRITEVNERMNQLLERMTMLDEDIDMSKRLRHRRERRNPQKLTTTMNRRSRRKQQMNTELLS